MWEDIQAAILPGFILSFMIGPVFFVLLETSAIKGFRAAIAFDLGVVLADVLFIFAAYFSSFQLLENLSNQPGLYVFGGAILVVYGLTTIIKKATKNAAIPKETVERVSKGYVGLFIKGFLLNFINIGVLVFWLGVIIVVGPSLDNDSDRILTFFTAMILAYFITDIFKILLAKRLKRKLTKERIRLIKKGIGVILIICGLVLMIKGFLPKDKFNLEKGLERIENIR
ncbi:LysE family translocator [Aggregatimonas sangjinii]|uniref:LysE family translocator n=1 Tax=Aggregatimonas sangjinii TaxID=2583587 RepID=A0A5B7SUD2_9FLAO|nr:LysE family transporter [Aggregatimonas sangjinii]QCX02415.1 LysE family translocator [Aggregatimonas sangjinii]